MLGQGLCYLNSDDPAIQRNQTLELWPGGEHRALYYRLSAAATSINNTQLITHKQPELWNAWTLDWAVWDVPAMFVKAGIKHTHVEI